jgi:hypothetical protein
MHGLNGKQRRKLLRRCSALLLALTSSLGGLARTTQENFVLDSSKPFVYLKFERIGPRKPVLKAEAPLGLWLRLVNNCRVPIQVGTVGFEGEVIVLATEP